MRVPDAISRVVSALLKQQFDVGLQSNHGFLGWGIISLWDERGPTVNADDQVPCFDQFGASTRGTLDDLHLITVAVKLAKITTATIWVARASRRWEASRSG